MHQSQAVALGNSASWLSERSAGCIEIPGFLRCNPSWLPGGGIAVPAGCQNSCIAVPIGCQKECIAVPTTELDRPQSLAPSWCLPCSAGVEHQQEGAAGRVWHWDSVLLVFQQRALHIQSSVHYIIGATGSAARGWGCCPGNHVPAVGSTQKLWPPLCRCSSAVSC